VEIRTVIRGRGKGIEEQGRSSITRFISNRARTLTPHFATGLTLHEEISPALAPAGRFLRLAPQPHSAAAAYHPGIALRAPDTGLSMPLRRESLRRRLLGVADAIAAMVALLVVINIFGDETSVLAAIAAGPLVVLVCKLAGLYDRDELRLVHSTLDEAPVLLQISGLFALGVTILHPLVLGSGLADGQIAVLWLGTFGSLMAARMLARRLSDHLSPPERCVVIGDPQLADRIRGRLSESPRARVVATVPLGGADIDAVAAGDPSHLAELVDELHVHRIIIAPTSTAQSVGDLVRAAKAVGVRVSVLPRLFEVVGSAVEFDDVNGMPMLGVRPFGLPRSSRLIKRAFDLMATVLGMLLVGPLMALIALAIRLDSPGPVFFRQVRVGRDGQHFHILKFRSMVIGADAEKDRLRALNEAGDGMFKLADDPRVTRMGKLLRRTSLDELPQVLNVLRGEMSLVGPRPLVTEEDVRILGLDRSRLHLMPGMTGPWQIGPRVPMREMVGIDYRYVSNWSLWLDVKLLLRTARHMFRRGNA
jgi:exopolysaccharide biosynthesis polyprenyl glycosylphosphotransferase